MSGPFMAFTWTLSLVAAVLATLWLKAPRVLGIVFGALLAQGLMFVGGHQLGIAIGPTVNLGGTETYIVVNIVMALIGGFLGAGLARLIRKNK
jgi:hypothetical protein